MAYAPSVGDVLMLSQAAWKIGRAFAHGKKSAPREFAEIERESNSLSEALKLVAETLHADGSILAHAEEDTRAAVNTILESAQKTLDDLESFVERYQVIKKKETNGGFVVERSWSEVVLANYKTFKWTTEGGDITELRNMLAMHTSSINLTMQALQSNSLARLERTVVPMAENIASIHDRVNGDLGDKINDVHRFLMAIASGTPVMLPARERSQRSVSTSSESSTRSAPRMLDAPGQTSLLPLRLSAASNGRVSSTSSASNAGQSRSTREDSAYYSPNLVNEKSNAYPQQPHPQTQHRQYSYQHHEPTMDWGFENGSPEEDRQSITAASPGDSAFGASEAGPSQPPSRRESRIPRRESTTLPNLFNAIDEAIKENGYSIEEDRRHAHSLSSSPNGTSRSRTWRLSASPGSLLPPPAMHHSEQIGNDAPATPSSFFSSPRRSRTNTTTSNPLTSPRPRTAHSSRKTSPIIAPTPSYSEGSKFERQLFRNAAILCDVRGRLVEYAQKNPDEPDPRYDTDMLPACKEARICVVRKRENREHVGTKVVTSVWTLSDDGEVRMQQKLSEVNETVPYCSYFEPEKVSLQPTDGPQLALRFHGDQWGGMLREEKKTNWVNYYFASENDAVAFQSAVFGRMLIGSYRTTKTTVIHEGLKGVLAFEEQFANIEMLRLWEDDGVSTSGAAGGVLALMHVSSNFGDGWSRFWLNSSDQHVKIKHDGSKHAKVKGINVTVIRPGATAAVAAAAATAAASIAGTPTSPAAASPPVTTDGLPPLQRVDTTATTAIIDIPPPNFTGTKQRRVTVKHVSGIRIEFKSEEERDKFVATAKRAQERLIPLPDVA